MSYKFSTGSVRKGDIFYEDDMEGQPTYIDFARDTITLRPSGSAILYTQHNRVGIGTTSPDYTLDVAGDIGVDEYIYHNGDADTLIQFANDKIVLKAGNRALLTTEVKSSQPHEVTINDGANNVDFVVKGNGSNAGNPLFKCDASTGRVGINGVGSPDCELHVAGDIKAAGSAPEITVRRDDNADASTIQFQGSGGVVGAYVKFLGDESGAGGTNNDLALGTGATVTERMRIRGDGKVGIGTTAPKTTLDVHHDPTSLANDTGGGEVVTFGAGPSGGSTTAGKLYYLDTDGQWEEADADALASSGVLLAIALGTSPSTHGMLLRGFFDVHSYFIGTFNEGVPVYVSTTAGSISVNAPSGGGDIVRIVGFCTTTANVIYFNPSNNTLELS